MCRNAVFGEDGPHEVSHIKLDRSAFGIGGTLVRLIGSLEIGDGLMVDLLELLDKVSGITMWAMRGWNRSEVQRTARDHAVDDTERAKTGASVDGVIVSKFRLAKLQIPRLDGFSDETTQKIAKRLVYNFGLPIGLRMIRATKVKPRVHQAP